MKPLKREEVLKPIDISGVNYEPFSDAADRPKSPKYLEGKPFFWFVLSGTRSEYEQWTYKENDKVTVRNSKFLRSYRDLVGRKNYMIMKYGSWRERGDLKKIEAVHRANVDDKGKFETFSLPNPGC